MTRRIGVDARMATLTEWAESGQYPVSRTTLSKAVNNGRLRWYPLGERRKLVTRDDLERWLLAGAPTSPGQVPSPAG